MARADSTEDGPEPSARWFVAGAGFAASRLIGQGLEFIGFVVLARRLDIEAFGSLWLAFLAARYLGLLGDWGANLRGARDVARAATAAEISSLVYRRTVATGILTIALAAALVAVGRWELVALVGCVLARGMNRDWLRLGRASGLAAGLPSVIQGVATLSLALMAGTEMAAALAVGSANVLALVVSIRLNPIERITSAEGERRPVNGWLAAGSIADQVSQTADSFLLGALLTVGAAGVYGAVYRLPNAGTTVLGLVVGVLTAQLASVLASNPERGEAELRRSQRAAGAAAAVVALSAPGVRALVVPVLGEPYRDGRTAALLLMLALAVVCASAPLHAYALATGQDRSYVQLLCGAAVLNVASNVVLIPAFELTGAALATLLSTTALQAGLLVTVRKHRRDVKRD